MSQFQSYFNVLGIPPTANKALIKKAYRQLAFQYHPDYNKDKNAPAKFVEINEAYEVLMGLRPLRSKKQYSAARALTPEEILAIKMKQARDQFEKLKEQERLKDLAYFNKYFTGWRWKWFKIVSVYMTLLNLFIVADNFLEGEKYTVLPHEFYPDYWGEVIHYNNDRFPIYDYEFWLDYPPIRANTTFFFDDVRSISYIHGGEPNFIEGRPSYRMWNYASFNHYSLRQSVSMHSVYGLFPYMNFIMLLPIFVWIFKRPSFWFNILRLVSVYVLFFYTFVISLSNYRILHLLQIL